MPKKHNIEVYCQAQEFLRYEPETGLFYWKESRGPVRSGDVAGAIMPIGYIFIGVNKCRLLAHRLAYVVAYDELPDEIDHINHNRQDNRICNLRAADRTGNGRNLTKKKNNTSGETGVFFGTREQAWVASIMVDRKCIYLGKSSVFEEAVAMRRAADKQYGFHENHGQTIEVAERAPLREKELRGVSFNKRDELWYARMSHNGKELHLGCYKTEAEAIARRQLAEDFRRAFA